MKNRKGVGLPLIIAIMIFIFSIGAIYVKLANSSINLSSNNLDKIQSYYLSRAGIEMGTAFLYAPYDKSTIDGKRSWFDLGEEASPDSLASIRMKLNQKTQGQSQIKSVYMIRSGEGSTRQINSINIVDGPPTTDVNLFGTIEVQIEIVDNGNSNKKEDSVYRITSTGRLHGKNNINSTQVLHMDIQMTNEFGKELY